MRRTVISRFTIAARVDIRVGTMPTIYGESLVMRLLEKIRSC